MNQQLTPPSVIHIGELGFGADNLGRQYALNYAEDSTDENPIVIAKGNDEYGQQFEERIYLNDIDLNNASYLEMAALAAHTKTDSCVPTAMTSGHHDYFQKENYVDDFNKYIADLYQTGSYDAALYETSILRKYMDYFQSIGKQQTGTRDFYVNRTDDSYFGIDTKNSISQEIEFPIETERYKIEDAAYVDGVAAYEIVDKQTGKDFYIREDQLAIQRDEKTGMEFLINMDQPFSYHVAMTGELKNLLNDLAEKRDIDIKEIPLQGGLVVNHDPKTGLNYLSIKGDEAQGVSVILTSDKDIETLNKLADEFQKYPVSSQRSTAGLYALLEISGNLKREKDGFTFLTPNGITYIPYDGDPDQAWEIDMPASCYATARNCLAAENDCASINTWTR